MNTVDFIWNGQTLHLLLNGAALFDIFDRYGSDAEILELIAGSGRKDLEATCWILAKLAEQGELARRYLGYDREKPPQAGRLMALMAPMEIPRARLAITQTVRQGFGMRHGEAEEYTDLGLQELQKKNGIETDRVQYFQTVTQFLRLPPRAVIILTPGETADLVNLEIKRRGLKRKED